MPLRYEPYLEQRQRWPATGRHILAQYDENSIIVYQAYRPAIGHFAARHGFFGGEFSLSRMSWIKPNFLWMAYRSGWSSKEGQEVTLAVRLRRSAFDTLIAQAVHSSFVAEIYADKQAWKKQLARSSVRLQWDPDHDPSGAKLERRAIQLGLRDEVLRRYAREWIIEIEDISAMVRQQVKHVRVGDYAQLLTPHESVYPVADPDVARMLGVASSG